MDYTNKAYRKNLKERAVKELRVWGDRADSYYESAIQSSKISTKKLAAIFIQFIGKEQADALECVIDRDYEKLDRYFQIS